MNIRKGKLLYHLTHIDNLESIVKNGLLPRSSTNNLIKVDVANWDILEKRHNNHLDDFVLFHFHPYTAFDTAVKSTYGPENFVYITVYREYAERNNFKIVPRHPLNGEFEICEYGEGIEKINWEIMEKTKDMIESNMQSYAKEVKMAECISDGIIWPDNFAYIYCNEQYVKELKRKYPKLAEKIQSQVWLK